MKCEGSRDTGAQLFCAMLRAVGVEARLVCSLQPLPLASSPATVTRTPERPKQTIYARTDMSEFSDLTSRGRRERSTSPGPKRIKRFGQSRPDAYDLGKPPTLPTTRPRKGQESAYPVFWVEVFNTALQKWHPIDPLVTRTIAKPSKFEPPLNDQLNDMTYVVGFDENGCARDVTRRYAKAYNAKTRRARVEASKDGSRWWRKALKIFRDRHRSDQDQVEDAELAAKEAAEPMPRNVLDFKDHPYYALERHLRRTEVIHPKREVGKLSTGKAAAALEPIYRRRDVLSVKSADKWYRAGREIKPDECPVKHNTKRRHRARSMSVHSATSDPEQDQIGLYAEHQTNLYVPPSVTRGKVPRNAFGNLDLYVPSMIPPGAAHIRAADAAHAARIAGVDFADAVIGFSFKGRQGTAVKRGVVVAKEYAEAIEEVIGGLRYQRELVEQAKRTRESLRLWKRFFLGLKLRARIMGGHSDAEEAKRDNDSGSEYHEEERKDEGGFFLDSSQAPIAQPTVNAEDDSDNFQDPLLVQQINEIGPDAGNTRKQDYWDPTVYSPWDRPGMLAQYGHQELQVEDSNAGYETPPGLFDDAEGGGGFVPEDAKTEEGGGFVGSESGDLQGGGFIPDDGADLGGGGLVTGDDLGAGNGRSPPASDHGDEVAIAVPTVKTTLSPEHIVDTAGFGAREGQAASPNPVKSDGHGSETTQKHPSAVAVQSAEHDTEMQDVNEASDKDSLMSHDPDDEDAEPDWLAEEASL